MGTQTGIPRLTYNSMWGHYALHWESNDGDFIEDDYYEVQEIIENFRGSRNNPNWFIEKAESELDKEMGQGNIKKGDNWCYTWIIEEGEIGDCYF